MTGERLPGLAERSMAWARHFFPGPHLFSGQELEAPAPTDIGLRNSRYVVFDTELTGLSLRRDSVVSLGAVVIEKGRISIGETFYRVVSPRRYGNAFFMNFRSSAWSVCRISWHSRSLISQHKQGGNKQDKRVDDFSRSQAS